MSEFKVGDKVKVKDSSENKKGMVAEIVAGPDSYGIYQLKSGHITFYMNERHLELVGIAPPSTQTKMLHELIALAKAGVKFKAVQKLTILNNESYVFTNRCGNWTTEEVTDPWQYEEIKEPRVVEFEATVTEINSLAVNLGNFYIFHDSMKELAGRKVKVVATEVVE